MRNVSLAVFFLITMIVGVGVWTGTADAQPYPSGVQPPPSRVPTGTPVMQPQPYEPVDLAPPPIGDNPTTPAQMAVDQPERSTFETSPLASPTAANPPARPQGRIIRASRMIGQPIWNTQEQLIGTISDVVIDYQTARPAVLFAVSSGLAAVPQALVAVPAEAMLVRHEADGNDRLVLDISVVQFRNAPHVEPNQWGRISDPQFLARTREFYQAARRTAAKPLTVGNETNGPPRPGAAPGYSPGGYGASGPGTGADVGSRTNSGGARGAGLGGQTPGIGETPREATGGGRATGDR